MEWVTHFITEIYTYLNYRDDTGIDRLNRLYTVALLSAFVTLISSQQYVVGNRIVCWTPKEFTDAHNAYAQDICWLGHTNYYVSENKTTLDSPSSERLYPFLIYPWLPIILIVMTASFAAPYLLIWHGLSTRSGINIKRLMELKKTEELKQAIHLVLFRKYSIKSYGGFYVTSIYLLMKIFYIINLFGQIIFINKLLFGNYFNFDLLQILDILSVRYNMWSSAHLPIETMCDFMVRTLALNNNWYTIQCILPFNLFTKRIFALLIIWFIILLILNIIDLVFIRLWQQIWISSNRYNYIIRLFDLYKIHLDKHSNTLAINNQMLCNEFVYRYLGIDGYLLLKFIHSNLFDIDMSNLVVNLFNEFLEERNLQLERIKRLNNKTLL